MDEIQSRLSSSSNKMFVVVAGNVGSGKTTLTNKLAERFNWRPMFESVEGNPFLADFYKDMERWSYHLQVYFLTHRFNTHRLIEKSNFSAIQDRSIYEDSQIFARALFDQGKMSVREYEAYTTLYKTMIEFLNPPDVMIFLKRSTKKLMERIRQRDRDCEKEIPENYIHMLNDYYSEWYESYNLGKRIIVDTDDLDFLCNEKHFARLSQLIHDSLDQKDMFACSF